MTQLYVIVARNRADATEGLTKHRQGHLDHFDKIKQHIAVAGPIFDETGGSAGSLVVVRAADQAAAFDLIKGDPFYSQRIWSEVEVNAFKAASGDWPKN